MSRALVALRGDPLSVDEAIAHVRHLGAGGIGLFVGAVRDENEGRPVTKLEYEAYAVMAIAEMERIVGEISAGVPGVRLAVIHRTGVLSPGEIAVVCAASAPHRAEALDACRALIDMVKARVPIWKREHGPDGAYWVGWHDARCNDEGHRHDARDAPRQGATTSPGVSQSRSSPSSSDDSPSSTVPASSSRR